MPSTDIVEVLGELGIAVHREGREISCSCPFHPDRHPSMSVNAKSGLWICYSCGRGGTLSMLISEIGGSDADPDVILREIKHKRIPDSRVSTAPDDEPPPPDPLMVYAKYDGYAEVPDWALEARRLTASIARTFGIKWDKGWVIPIWAPDIDLPQNSLWGWQWKRMSDVLNWPTGVEKSKTLFGLRELGLVGDMTTIALVESPLDVVRLASCNVAAVASFGAYVSKTQQQLLVEHASRILLALDNDVAGEAQARKIYPYLSRQVPTAKVIYPDGVKDPGDMTDDQIERAFIDLQGRAIPIPGRRRRHDAEPQIPAARSRSWSG